MKKLFSITLFILCSFTSNAQKILKEKEINNIETQLGTIAKPSWPYEEEYAFMQRNLVYPASATKCGWKNVEVRFVVDTTGNIYNIKSDEQDPAFAEEALRLVSLMPPWIPASKNGMKVNSNSSKIIRFEYVSDNKKDFADSLVFTSVENMPMYSEGEAALVTYFKKNLRNPLRIEGNVFIKFIVAKDGSIYNITCLRSPNSEASTEAIRLVKEMGPWTPGRQGGRPQHVYFTLPIHFGKK